MKLIILTVLASTALVPASALAQGTGSPNQSNQGNQASQARQIAVSDLEGRDVYTAQGQTIGQIDSVVLGQNNQPYAVVSFDEFLGLGGESRLVPLSRVTLEGDRTVVPNMGDAEFRSLQTYRANMAGFREANQNQQVALGGQTQNQQGGSRIVVQRTAPTVRVDQADPRVTVRQPQPQVTVNQAQPEIIVRQPQPTVRVDIPQPEIIVRMPEPDVNVAMAQPQVEVNQPQPQVQVVPPRQQPQVQVEQSQPQVQVQRQAGAEPQVQVQQAEGQPRVRYERAEPRVIVNQAQGEPTVRIERQGEGRQADAQGRANQPQEQTAQQNQQQAAASGPQATGALPSGQAIAVSRVTDMDLYNARGNELGDVERVVQGQDGKQYLVVGAGGFLGIGERKVAIPTDRVAMQGDRLVIQGVTEDQIRAMQPFDANNRGFRELENSQQVQINAMR